MDLPFLFKLNNTESFIGTFITFSYNFIAHFCFYFLYFFYYIFCEHQNNITKQFIFSITYFLHIISLFFRMHNLNYVSNTTIKRLTDLADNLCAYMAILSQFRQSSIAYSCQLLQIHFLHILIYQSLPQRIV